MKLPTLAEQQAQWRRDPHWKPEPRVKAKNREKRHTRAATGEIRAYVFAREGQVCRICRFRPATSMHEIIPRSLCGKVSHENSIAICGDGVQGCHGFVQRHEILVRGNAEAPLTIRPQTERARLWMGT